MDQQELTLNNTEGWICHITQPHKTNNNGDSLNQRFREYSRMNMWIDLILFHKKKCASGLGPVD